MGIAADQIRMIEAAFNEKLSKEQMTLKMSVHFVKDRMNHPRNIPSISPTELYSIFNRLFTVHISKLQSLEHGDTFNIRCSKTDINMPCAVNKTKDDFGRTVQETYVITIMRKKNFVSKDPVEFIV